MAVLIVNVDGSGSVTSKPAGIDCRTGIGSCAASFPVGTTVELTATTAETGIRFVGWAGLCSGTAACSITVSVPGTAQVLAAFDARMVNLLAANTGSVIALNSHDVFYSSTVQPYLPQSTEIVYVVRAISKNGGAARDVAVSPNYVIAMRANDDWVYWTAGDSVQGRIYRAPAQGGAAETLFIGQRLSDIALDEVNAYFANFSGQGAGSGAVYAVPIAGGPPSVLANNVTPFGGLTADATDVYFSDDPPYSTSLKRVSKSGGAPITVMTSPVEDDFRILRADSQSVYYLDAAGGINAWHKSDGTITTIVPAATGTNDFAVSGSTIFWTIDYFNPRYDPNPDPEPGLKRANSDGSAAQYLDDTPRPESGWESPRADDNYVFYLRREFGLFRVLR
jgi:hypothetical protein